VVIKHQIPLKHMEELDENLSKKTEPI